jgi:hypothetical protein
MKDHLLDIVSHTHDLGSIELVKIVGDDKQTVITGLAEDRSIVLEGKFSNPVADFTGTFGMPNLAKLKTILGLEAYKEDAKLTLSRTASGSPDGINFENKDGDFKNNYRFMASEIINEKLKAIKMKAVTWNIDFEPSITSIQRLKMQAAANSEEPTFQVKTENGNLKFVFGDHSTHSGNFVFQSGVQGELKRGWAWPVKTVIGILDLYGDKTFKISDEGVAMITVDSGIAVYEYKLPAQPK